MKMPNNGGKLIKLTEHDPNGHGFSGEVWFQWGTGCRMMEAHYPEDVNAYIVIPGAEHFMYVGETIDEIKAKLEEQ